MVSGVWVSGEREAYLMGFFGGEQVFGCSDKHTLYEWFARHVAESFTAYAPV